MTSDDIIANGLLDCLAAPRSVNNRCFCDTNRWGENAR